MSEEKKDFVVKDRRLFSEEKDQEQKEPAESGEKPAGKKPEVKPAAEAAPDKDAARAREEPEAETQLPEINFLTFVMSLNASALVNLGMVEDPVSKTKVKNLPLAKQTIDMLGMLQEKTRGNLTADEENLLKHILYELRMIYIKEKK